MKREKPKGEAKSPKPGPEPLRLKIDPDDLGGAMSRIVNAGKPKPKVRRKKK
jgi:hypothetical protein